MIALFWFFLLVSAKNILAQSPGILCFVVVVVFCFIGSLFLHTGFLKLWQTGVTVRCGAWASHCGGFSCCGGWALGVQASVVVDTGSVVVACGL